MLDTRSQPPWEVAGASGVPQDSAFHRLWRAFMSARVTIAVVLMALFAFLYGIGGSSHVGGWLMSLCGTYLVAALAVRVFTRPLHPGHAFDPQWVTTIGIDLIAFSTLQFLQAGGLNYVPLFALPVLTAAVLGSALLALGTAAAVTLLLLGDAWILSLQQVNESTSRFLQAGLTGIGYFAVALLANQLAVRLAREEREARRSLMLARTQAQVNEVVIETLGDGVLVVGLDLQVHTANPAARRMLGGETAATPFQLHATPAWAPLVALAQRTFVERAPLQSDVALEPAPGERQLVHVRTRLTTAHDTLAESVCVMFLEDLREMEARLRTEKLAAMGRMSAAVAHEIRNPLAAIAQANDLLGEELHEPVQKQLSALVQQNARRLSHIVEEILDIARVQQQVPAPSLLLLDEEVRTACAEWQAHTQAGERLVVAAFAPGRRVAFESEHLRRVLVNLLDNALRYASQAPGALRVSTQWQGGQAWLRVWSDGAPLEQGVQRHLFEPFFSSESRSSGLGLYICRELCERHGATIGYRRAKAFTDGPDGNEFFVAFRTQAAQQLAGAPPFDTMTA